MSTIIEEFPLKSTTKRHADLDKMIKATFNKTSHAKPRWLYNGEKKYNLYGIDDYILVKKILKTLPSRKKNFYILDIGSGDSRWALSIANMLNEYASFPKDMIIHIISVTGEYYGKNSKEQIGQCILYYLEQFEIEN